MMAMHLPVTESTSYRLKIFVEVFRRYVYVVIPYDSATIHFSIQEKCEVSKWGINGFIQ